ncbi:SigE family RNA polymerase sigma factor [Virgisporangium ochraceum]|uniref:RNA polymerase sigma factor n=1 Tax=Virgisporangium ochraceum TaxID=65505 RepID=A0A8J3ZRI1_9ACTN|nr:SigE family RNA polymerase sigma factor [Virgisporangium ochraceum]GIJ68867.1 RNA polymerase sigma factor [Virgisporangium ochraceum]
MRALSKRPEFDAFVANRWPRLLRVAYLLTGDWAGAEDLVQTALVKAWFAWRRIGGDPEPYVRRIVVTTFVSHRRRRWIGEVPVGTVPDVMGADAAAGHADRDLLWRALLRLPAKQRAVLVLRYFEDLSEEQIAATLGVRAGTVKSQASKALARLRLDESLVDNTGRR